MMSRSDSGSLTESLSLLLLRIPLGLIMMAHGSQKLFGLFGGEGVSATQRAFEAKLGISPLLSILAMFTEFGGGLAVLIGCLTRFSSLGIAVVMAMAMYKVHWANGFFLARGASPASGSGIEYTLALLGMALSLACSGGGKWSVDRYLWKR
jgi:putative oxidoreductase